MTLDQAFRFYMLLASCSDSNLKSYPLAPKQSSQDSRLNLHLATVQSGTAFTILGEMWTASTPSKMAYHLWHVWCLTRYCGHEIRLLDKDKVVRLDTVEENPISLGVIIFYHYYLGQETQCLQSLRKGFRYIGHTIGHDQEYGLHCDIDTCNCSNCL